MNDRIRFSCQTGPNLRNISVEVSTKELISQNSNCQQRSRIVYNLYKHDKQQVTRIIQNTINGGTSGRYRAAARAAPKLKREQNFAQKSAQCLRDGPALSSVRRPLPRHLPSARRVSS
ncbi:hypothetical protein EVAR_84518_1 [Eumeta japonica]|uniref:Uncharacterized protein n=1 Tax=Eumeta variegata TaxID=151549 RepID=A0A4C1UI17_EUMVA|nr:hypothetical protein EVAR_84518_1 [Eumeta japonica]